MKVASLMTREVRTVSPDTRVADVIELMRTERIHAVPVVDQSDKAVGLVSVNSLFPILGYFPFSSIQSLSLDEQYVERGGLQQIYRDLAKRQVSEVMEKEFPKARPEDEIEVAAETMVHHRVDSLPVIEEGRVVGILSRSDLLGLSIGQGHGKNAPE